MRDILIILEIKVFIKQRLTLKTFIPYVYQSLEVDHLKYEA